MKRQLIRSMAVLLFAAAVAGASACDKGPSSAERADAATKLCIKKAQAARAMEFLPEDCRACCQGEGARDSKYDMPAGSHELTCTCLP